MRNSTQLRTKLVRYPYVIALSVQVLEVGVVTVVVYDVWWLFGLSSGMKVFTEDLNVHKATVELVVRLFSLAQLTNL